MRRRAQKGRYALLLAAIACLVLLAAPPAQALTRAQVGAAAAKYAADHGYRVGIAVYDTKTGELRGSGYYKSVFASESVVTVFIATRLLVRGVVYGNTERMVYKMITQSDDAIASALYGSVGGDSLINWIKSRYNVPDLGYPPTRPGWWGNTRITPIGIAKLYAKLKRDPKVGPWLINAMHHATKYGSDGVYQFFGLPSATYHPAVKQGWGNDFNYGSTADFNTTGYVDGDRYAVAILARGPSWTYGAAIGGMLTHVARLLLPYNGWYPAPYPKITALSRHTSPLTGGVSVTIYGSDFVGMKGVRFGATAASYVRISRTELRATAPAHTAVSGYVHVLTDHGNSATGSASAFSYIAPPTVTSLVPSTGPLVGGDKITVTGTDFRSVQKVLFGSVAGTSVMTTSSTMLTVIAPPHAPAGTVDIRVVTAYGTSPIAGADLYAYVAPPAITAITPSNGPQAGGTTVHLSGTDFRTVTAIQFGDVSVLPSAGYTPTDLDVVVPAGAVPGQVPVRVVGRYGTSEPVTFTYT
jgi:hypothetical protein